MEVKDLLGYIQTGGMVGLLVVILWGGIQRWWVFGWAYDEKCKEIEEWKQAAKSSTNAAEEAVKIAALLRKMELREETEDVAPRRAPRRTRRPE